MQVHTLFTAGYDVLYMLCQSTVIQQLSNFGRIQEGIPQTQEINQFANLPGRVLVHGHPVPTPATVTSVD